MRVAAQLRVCGDCLQAIANGLDSLDGVESPERLAEIESGMARLGPHLVPAGGDLGFMRSDCDCCGTELYGERYAAAQLTNEPETAPSGDLRPLVEHIATCFQAMMNCERPSNEEWRGIWSDRLDALVREHMPSGSGFDSGTTFEREESRPDKIIFSTSFHHMNESGVYDGWTDHRVVVTPSFIGRFELKVTGRDKRGIKDYVADTFGQALDSMVRLSDLESSR